MTDHYSTEQETKALIRPDTRTESEKQAAKLAEENWLNEQGMEMTFNESEKSQQRKVATGVTGGNDQVKKLIEDAVKAECEACAKLMDKLAEKDNLTNYFKFAANAIRERNTK